ncbi:MAG: hypothetical protein QNJ32_26295 [Xenococcaceae cyanobacterium MO_167.B27]|nr:hypothetical protein [Xenococcaceae cyanobacterium MO_167.B27]
MNTSNNKKLFIIQPKGYKYQDFEPLLSHIEDYFNMILSFLKISTPSGNPTVIELTVDIFNPEKISAYAKRITKDPPVYQVRMNAGLSFYLWTVSRTFWIPDYEILPWIEECKINVKNHQEYSKKDIISDCAFLIGSYYILLHEIAHIVLGHLDYLNDEMNLDYLSEFQDEQKQYSAEELRIRKAFEAEADRQAGQWLVGFFENLLGKNGIGEYFLFPSRVHAYEFYVYAIVAVFRLLQDLTQREGVIHPKPNERLYVLIASLSKYFKQNIPDEHDEIYFHAVKSCLEAGKKFFLIDSFEPLDIILNANNLAFVDDVVREINISSYQHNLTSI